MQNIDDSLDSFAVKMSSCREIITLQFGNYANYVGAHWWNIQEAGFSYDPNEQPSEINHDVLYREGVDFKRRVTYTPRLLLLDLQGALQHVPEAGSLYHEEPSTSQAVASEDYLERLKSDVAWEDDSIEVVKSEPLAKTEFQRDLDDPKVDITDKEYDFASSVQTWSDFLYTRYHPRTTNIIKNYKHSDSVNSFDTFSNGTRIWQTEFYEDEFGDKIRQYLEECNNCQGFQMIFDCNNGFAGLSLKCLEYLSDEYAKVNLAFPVFNPKSLLFENSDEPMADSIRVVNTALAYSRLTEHSSLFVPLSTMDRVWRQLGSPRKFPLLDYQSDSLYQTSAILASYLDTVSLRYRVKNPIASSYLANFCTDLNNYNRKLVSAALGLPFSMRCDEDLIDCLDRLEGSMFTSISPSSSIGTDYVVQSTSIRGIPKTRIKRPMKQAQRQMKMAAYKCDSVSEMLQLYFQCSYHASLTHVSAVQFPHPVKTPYPLEMLNQRLNSDGFLQDFDRTEDQKITSMPVVASVQCSGKLSTTLESLHREASRIKLARIHRFKETGLESDEYVEVLEQLLNFKDNYDDNFDL